MVWGEGQAEPAWNVNLNGSANQFVGNTVFETTHNLNIELAKLGEYEAYGVTGLKIWLPTDRIRPRIQFNIRKKVSMGNIGLEKLKIGTN